MTGGSEGTPLADAVLRDPLGVPQGLDLLLRRVESGARRLHASLGALAEREGAVPAVREAAAELNAFLHDPLRSPLHRALRRPLRQIAPGSTGALVLQQAFDGTANRADRAAQLQAAVTALRAATERVRDRFAHLLPRATRQALERARVGEVQIGALRRAADADALHARLHAAERELLRLESHVDRGLVVRRGAGWDEEASPEEIMACLALRLRERDRLLQQTERGAAGRGLSAAHVRALAAAAPPGRAAQSPAQTAAEQAARALLEGESHARGGEDLALWGTLLSAAGDALHDGGRAGAWAPSLPQPPADPDLSTGATRFAIAIDGTYALITPEIPGGVRVRDRGVELDRTVECVAFSPPERVDTVALARLDVEPLFDGLETQPGWYATGRNARLRVIGWTARGFLARIEKRGSLLRSPTPPWVAEGNEGARLRVLGSLAGPAPREPVEVGAADGPVRAFAGVGATPVRLPYVDSPAAWLRTGADAWAVGAVEGEAEFFRAVARHVPHTVCHAAGTGHCRERGETGPLYIPPLGARLAESPPLERWLRARHAIGLLGAVARLWLRLAEAGCGLGVYHEDELVFRPDWSHASGPAGARAVVVEAPFGTPLGRYLRRPPPGAEHVPLYARLGVRVVPAAVAAGEVALPETEARAFALFALDALADAPLPPGGLRSAADVGLMAAEYAHLFSQPALVPSLAAALAPAGPAAGVIHWINLLAEHPGG